MSDRIEQTIIIGSGPAGYTAAIYASRANLAPLMFEGEESGGQLMTTTDVENYPGFPKGIMGPEVMELFKQQAERFGTKLIMANVDKVDFSQRPFVLESQSKIYKSHTVIIATGATAKYLGLESEKTFLGKGVSACATCDGAFFKNQKVCIVGGGDTAMEEALFLIRFATKVLVLHRRDVFRASKIMADKVLQHEKIEVLWNTELKEVLGDDVVTSIDVYNNQTKKTYNLAIDGVFIAIGHKPNTELFKSQLKLNNVGYILTEGKSTKTSIEGVFASGDVQDPQYRQAVTAAGTGCMAALDAQKWLESQE